MQQLRWPRRRRPDQAVVDKCIEMGITFFDTADIYGRGKSEEFMAPAIKPHRRNIVIATKSAASMGEGPYWGGLSRRYLMDALDDCLRRLQTDYIDLYQMHFPDPKTPVDETLRALDDMVRSGKVRYIGCSNFAGWQVVEADWTSRTEHLSRFVSAQNEYSLLERAPRRRAGARRSRSTASACCPTSRSRPASSPASTARTKRRPKAHASAVAAPSPAASSPKATTTRWRSSRPSPRSTATP